MFQICATVKDDLGRWRLDTCDETAGADWPPVVVEPEQDACEADEAWRSCEPLDNLLALRWLPLLAPQLDNCCWLTLCNNGFLSLTQICNTKLDR